MDMMKSAYKRASYNETFLENEDKLGEDFDWSDKALDDLQFEDYFSDEDEMLNNFTGHTPMYHDVQNTPGGKFHMNMFYYNTELDMTEYQENILKPGTYKSK